jgi:hypothetical protein
MAAGSRNASRMRKQKTLPLPLAGRGWGGGDFGGPTGWRNSRRAIRPAPRSGGKERSTGHVPTAGDPEPCATGRLAGGESVAQINTARSGRVPRRRVFAMSSLGTGPLRDRPRTGFRSGHLMKRVLPHTVSLMPCGPAFRLVRIARVPRAGRAAPPELRTTPRAMPLPDG